MIHILQLLCPRRHCFIAVVWDDTTKDLGTAYVDLMKETARAIGDDPERLACGLCGSHDLKPEDGVTRWRTLEEARPHLEAAELAQQLTRVMLTGWDRRN
jgi:hypothetical protein